MNKTPDTVGDPRRNQLLAALPEADWQRLAADLEAVELSAGQVLCESGSTPTSVFFPATSLEAPSCVR